MASTHLRNVSGPMGGPALGLDEGKMAELLFLCGCLGCVEKVFRFR